MSNSNNEKVDDDDDDDDHYTDIGFLFEGAEASTLKYYDFEGKANTKGQKVKVALHVVDQDPGAVQSGHYLWPGAPALAQHLVDTTVLDEKNNNNHRPKAVLELGAGCALTSIVALQLYADSLETIVTTDYDPGTLERAARNHDATLEYLDDYDFAQRLFSVNIQWESLKWGDETGAQALGHQTFDLILGSDLIYDFGVVKPLFQTVSWLLMKKNDGSKFILSQSFSYDDETESEIDALSEKLGLERTILEDNLSEEGGVKLQYFTWKK